MKHLIAAMTMVLAAAGCTVVENDTTQVAALATSVADPTLANCATALEPLVGPTPTGGALLYQAARGYELKKLFQPGGACEGISAEIAALAINKLLPGGL